MDNKKKGFIILFSVLGVLVIAFLIYQLFFKSKDAGYFNEPTPQASPIYGNPDEMLLSMGDTLTQKEVLYKVEKKNNDDWFGGRLIAKIADSIFTVFDEQICVKIAAQRDFDEDGYTDVLVENVNGCGGNCCANSYFFCSYIGDGKFKRSEEFGYFLGDPVIEKWKGKWSVVVLVQNEGMNTDFPIEITQRYILDNGKAVKVEENAREPLSASPEMLSSEFSGEFDEVRSIQYDLDGDGLLDTIEGKFWERWGRIMWNVQFSSGMLYEGEEAYKRIGISKNKTNGVHDLIVDIDKVLKWDGEKYME